MIHMSVVLGETDWLVKRFDEDKCGLELQNTWEICQVWWYTLVTPAPGKWRQKGLELRPAWALWRERQEYQKFRVIFGYIVSSRPVRAM